MVKLRCLIALGLFCAKAALAQGTMLFTWHGQSNLFQGSFQVSEAQMQSGVPLSSPVFFNSISFTSSLSGIAYTYDTRNYNTLGSVNPWVFVVDLFDVTRGTQLTIYGGEPPVGGMAGSIEEHSVSSGPYFDYTENGHFSVSQIPEPSSVTLSTFGLLTLIGRRCRA
jgi:hypothetical protein